MDRLEAHRKFFADLITTTAGVPKGPLNAAFVATPRERFVGPGPWKVFAGGGYITTPTDDPAFLYQDITVALSESDKINNGQPVLHAVCLAMLNPREGDTVVHIGAGTGYYTALLAHLTGPTGQVHAYEINTALAERAAANLSDLQQVIVHAQSAAEGTLPSANLIYVNAGATAPLEIWLDALRPSGKLLFPLTPDGPGGTPGAGAMLLVTRTPTEKFDARFIMPVMFIPCAGARDDETAKKLAEAFKRGDMQSVRSLRRHTPPDETSWCAGRGWWLSTAENT
ncbi:MAG TPA: rRNA adenine N-6-methyltransferase family protein [Candidatus Angelobacter sp.]|nr:rRNA adenine N-6-methyltransferase family protein [Candidatus Angelobacter sp.]